MFPECVTCIVKQTEQLLQRHCPDSERADEVTLDIIRFMASAENELKTAPALPSFLNDLLERRCRLKKAIRDDSKHCNDQFLLLEETIRNDISKSINPLQKALQYTLAGNYIMNHQGSLDNLEIAIQSAARLRPVIDDSGKLIDRIRKAEKVLFIGDKAGEIVTDKLLLEQFQHPNIFYAVKEKGILNEATVDDAMYAGIDRVARVQGIPQDISFFNELPGNSRFGRIYREADVIISKGHTNFWKLHNETQKETFFLFSAGCKVILNLLKIGIDDPVVMYGKRYQQKIIGAEKYETLCHEL
jgi:damage-control phosphatase, subfamily I